MSRPALLAPALAAAASVVVRRTLDSRTGPGWRRVNYRGREVTLSLGPATVAGLLAGIAADRSTPPRIACAAALSVGGAGVAGLLDDRASADEEQRTVKGFSGHLGALAHGNASAGQVKIAVIGATSLAAAAIRTGATIDTLIDGALVAGCANLVNLLDLRPGRALKASGAAALAPGPYHVVVGATVLAGLAADLGERSMLGDTGANALGAALGTAACSRSRRTRLVVLAVVAALTAASEKVSFSAVIAGNPVLSRVDGLGRRDG